MSNLILGMIGAILIFAAYKGGFYIGQKGAPDTRDQHEREKVSEDERLRREKIRQGINNIDTYSGRKGRDKS